MARKQEIQAQLEAYKNMRIDLERAAAENGHEFENLTREESVLGTKKQ